MSASPRQRASRTRAAVLSAAFDHGLRVPWCGSAVQRTAWFGFVRGHKCLPSRTQRMTSSAGPPACV